MVYFVHHAVAIWQNMHINMETDLLTFHRLGSYLFSTLLHRASLFVPLDNNSYIQISGELVFTCLSVLDLYDNVYMLSCVGVHIPIFIHG